MKSFVTFARRWRLRLNAMNAGISDSPRMPGEVAACEKCGSKFRVGRDLCLNCLLHRGLGADTETTQTLEEVLDEVDVRDADWRLGNYQILEEIGRGGMGVIYRARQRHSRRIVALKRVLSYHADSRETLARFRREAEAAASLDHPNILPIYEVSDSEDGLPFFSMKFAACGSLLDIAPTLRRDRNQIVRLMSKVARAVQHAHNQGILHRDLKPGNILLDGRGEPLVSDFGLAKWLDTSTDLTRTLTIFGTPGYIAPEQARGPAKNLTAAADIYSIGAILFDLFAGRPPFLGEHALAVIHQASEKSAPKLRSLAPRLDRDLETICARCLERDPAMRYRSAGDLAEDLDRWIENRPIIARPVSPPVRLWRWTRRNPKLASTATACVALGVFAVVAFLSRERLGVIVRSEAAAARSVAMLPFEDLDELTRESESARAVTETFRTELTHATNIGVTSAPDKAGESDIWKQQEWHDVGSQLGVRNLLVGTIRTRDGKKRATVQLLDSLSGATIRRWLYEADSNTAIAASVVNSAAAVVCARANHQILAPTTGEIPDIDFAAATIKPIAKDYYVAAGELRARLNVHDLGRAIRLLEKAVATDPSYAAAYAILASSYQAHSELDSTGLWLSKGSIAADMAIKLAPMMPEAHRARGGTLRFRGQFRQSLDSYLSAYELDPTSDRAAATLGNVTEHIGRPDLSLRWYAKAVRREARPGIYAEYIGDAWSDLGEDIRAESAYRRAITFRPDLCGGLIGLGRLELLQCHFQEARGQCKDAQLQFPNDQQPQLLAAEIEFFARRFDVAERLYRDLLVQDRAGAPNFAGSIRFLSALGLIRRLAGEQAQGDALLEEARALDLKDLKVAPDNPRFRYSLAAECAALGDADTALHELQNAIGAGWIDYRSLMLDPRFDSIRESARFKEIFFNLIDKVKSMDAGVIGRTGGLQSNL